MSTAVHGTERDPAGVLDSRRAGARVERRGRRSARYAVAATWLFGLSAAGGVLAAGGIDRLQLEARLATLSAEVLQEELEQVELDLTGLRQGAERMRAAAVSRQPEGLYIVVDTATNHLLMRQGDEVLLDAICSTGSGQELRAGGRTWVFNTPRGTFKVLKKVSAPIWTKPDWAFWEEGKKPPGARSPERIEEGVLGDYALALGDGYLIHGTLYKRTLGKSVTHGCIRLDDDDLAQVYARADIGTPVYIY